MYFFMKMVSNGSMWPPEDRISYIPIYIVPLVAPSFPRISLIVRCAFIFNVSCDFALELDICYDMDKQSHALSRTKLEEISIVQFSNS
jgi:hypothetical protein